MSNVKSDDDVAVVVMVCCDEDPPVWLLLLRDEFVVESVGGALGEISDN